MSNCRNRLRIRDKTQITKCEETITTVVTSSCKQTDSASSLESNISSNSVDGSSHGGKGDHLLCQLCRKHFTTHTDLHAHIALQHGRAFVKCSQCNANSHTLWRSNVCSLCGEFTAKLNEHESMHYRDKEGINAFFECSKCYKSFRRFNELKQHLVESHGEGRAISKAVKCMVCPMKFYSRHARDQHLVLHFKTVFEKLWQNICIMHEKFGALLQSNECPLCKHIMTTKRGLRRHVISRHLLQSFASSEVLVDELTIAKREESEAVRGVSNVINGIKMETVKENDKELSGMIEPEESALLKAVRHNLENANEDSLMEHNEEFSEDALERDYSIAMKDECIESGKTTALENGCQKTIAALKRSQRDVESQKGSIEEVQPFDRHKTVVDKNLSSGNSVMFPQGRDSFGVCRSSLNESTADATLGLNSAEIDNEKRDNEVRKKGMLADPPSSVANDMRGRLIALYLDRNARSPRCVRCKATFARMFDFEVHLIRAHISSLF